MKFQLKLFLLYTLFTLIISITCSKRERLNPIDPQNPETNGKIEKIYLSSYKEQVTLEWNPVHINNDFPGYKIYKKADIEPEFVFYSLVSPDSNIFIDNDVEYGHKYSYQVSVLADDFESTLSDTISISPGPTCIWVSDIYINSLIRLTHDCSHEIERIRIDGEPRDLFLDQPTNTIWFADVLTNDVYNYDLTLQKQNVIASFQYSNPFDFAVSEKFNQVWIADDRLGKVIVINKQGELLKEFEGFEYPYSIDINQTDGSCCICDLKKKSVIRISTQFDTLFCFENLLRPTNVSVVDNSGDCWIADSSRVIRLNSDGEIVCTIATNFYNALYLAADKELGSCWVLDVAYYIPVSKLYYFTPNGTKIFEIENLNWPENLTVNQNDHSCIVAESGGGRFVKIMQDGEFFGQKTGYDYPYGLSIEY